jgi:hypothetical protein
LLRQAVLGLIDSATPISEAEAHERCAELPADWTDEPIEAPHGDTLLQSSCSVIEYRGFDGVPETKWSRALYRWTLVFNSDDPSRPEARDIVTEEEVLLFESVTPGRVQAVWHTRIETGAYALWRSISPEIAVTDKGTILLSAMWCFNGTGGCHQEFLLRHTDRTWSPVVQNWLRQLPAGFAQRMHKDVRINPSTLEGEAGLYNNNDPNCCPSQRLLVRLTLHADALDLLEQKVIPWQQ